MFEIYTQERCERIRANNGNLSEADTLNWLAEEGGEMIAEANHLARVLRHNFDDELKLETSRAKLAEEVIDVLSMLIACGIKLDPNVLEQKIARQECRRLSK